MKTVAGAFLLVIGFSVTLMAFVKTIQYFLNDEVANTVAAGGLSIGLAIIFF